MNPLRDAILLKGSNEFRRQELLAILSLNLKAMSPKEAKAFINDCIEKGIIEVKGDILLVHPERVGEKEDIFEEMIEYLTSSLGWTREEILEDLRKFGERYGSLDRKLIAYLYGIEKGVDMSVFKERIE
ncbi:MAG: DUF2240 family protein [Palaeococcus sp.]|uniref:DUF2240 family protein n=1 Tax=Palaeococcus sp. (in: euryarchaeotes) TaxID=2820298 RepID=UPI0025CE4ED1|nr:DUF2240 family protein [Palaeococcus sp. (in: euryarchaeotes)]MCD6558710.1 DUF2240 family protein [Palaeococcus sp. (in: euryarchaeotes)]